MKERKAKIVTANIPIDCNRWVSDSDKEGSVLLYDAYNKCYYEASLSVVFSKVKAQYDAQVEELRKKFDESIEQIKEQQTKFIKDSSEINDTILRIAKEYNNHE